MKRYLIVVAGGKGLRMGGDMPKQFQLIGERPVLMVTIERLYAMDNSLQIVLVLPAEHIDFWKEMCKRYAFQVPLQLAKGGNTRFH